MWLCSLAAAALVDVEAEQEVARLKQLEIVKRHG